MGQETSERDDFCSLLLAGKLILNEGGHLPFLVFRRLVFSLNHPVWARQGDQFHFPDNSYSSVSAGHTKK
jgi:hypothetical protein